jgi:hypothetical protein
MLLQRSLHREIQACFLLITRRKDVTLALFSLLFFPGVLLHELSHFFVARFLGVRTGRFSLLPHPLPNGRLLLGYVETEKTDLIRDALIGVAPLITGGFFVAYAGMVQLGLREAWIGVTESGVGNLRAILLMMVNQPDFWLWFFLTFTISSMMFPSASDRRSWLPLILAFAVLIGVVLLAGAGPWLLTNFSDEINIFLRSLAVIIGISTVLHLVLFPPIWLLRHLLMRITGYRVA